MWKYVGEGRSIAGVPMEDMRDEEFEEIEARYDAQFSDEQKGSLRSCGLYEHVEKRPASKPEASASGGARPSGKE